MATYKLCTEHGLHEGKHCPKCPKPEDKRSPKYTTTIIVPPNMRAS